jgi:UDP-N-acetylmuramate: L-alanyl-gamma-D-glutamyl-meso-diaminopimelate ligase
MQAAFMRALALADVVYLGAVAGVDKLKADERFDTEAVSQHLATQGVDAHTAPTNADLLEVIEENIAEITDRPQLVVFFTNGSFDGIIGKFVKAVSG